jgi:hypothetical protein
MPKRRYEQSAPTHEWQQSPPLLKDTAQIHYKVMRPVIFQSHAASATDASWCFSPPLCADGIQG